MRREGWLGELRLHTNWDGTEERGHRDVLYSTTPFIGNCSPVYLSIIYPYSIESVSCARDGIIIRDGQFG